MKQTVLVTGATGFLGSHLVKRLLHEAYRVVILKRSSSDTWRIKDVLSQLVSYDIDRCELARPFQEIGGIDVVIHLATCYGRQKENVSSIFETNTVFPLRLLEAACTFNTSSFFNTDTILPKYLNNYSLSKKQFREWGEQFANCDRIRFVNIKLEQMFGARDDDSKFTTHVIKHCLANTLELELTLGEQKRDFVHVDDVVAAYGVLLDRVATQPESYQEYAVGRGRAISIRDFVEMVHQMARSTTILKFGALPYREREVMHSEANLKPLLAFGWKPARTLEEGLRQTIAWYSQERTLRKYQ